MAEFVVRNSLNPYKVVKLSITFEQQVLKGKEGDHYWVAEIATLEPDLNGAPIVPEYLHLITLDNLDKEVEKAVNAISAQIDWSPTIADTSEPYVSEYLPSQTSDVSIDSFIQLVLKDSLPSAGIDLSSINLVLNGVDISHECEITGDPYEYKVKWNPSMIIYETDPSI